MLSSIYFVQYDIHLNKAIYYSLFFIIAVNKVGKITHMLKNKKTTNNNNRVNVINVMGSYLENLKINLKLFFRT